MVRWDARVRNVTSDRGNLTTGQRNLTRDSVNEVEVFFGHFLTNTVWRMKADRSRATGASLLP